LLLRNSARGRKIRDKIRRRAGFARSPITRNGTQRGEIGRYSPAGPAPSC
jgi:hypothetical protein